MIIYEYQSNLLTKHLSQAFKKNNDIQIQMIKDVL